MRALFALLLLAAFAGAAERPGQGGIDYLLSFVEKSDCHFVRNGKEYRGVEAAAHLRSKLSSAGNRVQTVQDFIDGIATKSSLSGQPYQIRLADGQVIPSGQWLRDALSRRPAASP